MNKLIAAYFACSVLVILVADEAAKPSFDEAKLPSAVGNNMAFHRNIERSTNDVEEVEAELESELELKRMLHLVTPLMAIFQQQKKKFVAARMGRSAGENPDDFYTEDLDVFVSELVENGRKRGSGRRPIYKSSKTIGLQQPDRSGYGYGDYSSASSYGGGGGGGSYGCCEKKDDLLPILALTALSLLLLYLIAIATTTTTTAPGRKRRSQSGSIDGSNDNNLMDGDDFETDIEMLDAPTWVSMVDELWRSGEDESSDVCTLKALCRMNRLALDSPGSTGLAVSLSSVPLSFLLHHRHQIGFLTYLDASLMGRYGENCTTMFSTCARLN